MNGDDPDEVLEPFHVDVFGVRETDARCPCTWSISAAAANAAWEERAGALIRDLSTSNVRKVAPRIVELFQERVRAMIDHPDYGNAVRDCEECAGTGRHVDEAFGKYD